MTVSANNEVALDDVLIARSEGFVLTAFNPWAWPEVDGDVIGRSGRDGVIPGRSLRRVRRVPMEVLVNEWTRADAVAKLQRLTAAAGARTLRWFESGTVYRLEGRVRLIEPSTQWIREGAIPVEIRFEATDPRILSDDEHSAATGFPIGGEGRTYNLEFNRVYGAAGSGGSLSIDNAGTVAAPWRAEVQGPWVNPTIRNVATGDELRLSISLGPGDTLVLDSADETVFLGSAHRLNTVLPGSVWPTIEPGANEWRVGGASGSGLVTVWWRDAWL